MMIAVCVVCVAVIGALVYALRLQALSHRDAQAQWAEERRELLNRIQRPEYTPTAPAPFELPELPEDQYNLVGTIAPLLEEN